MSQGKPFVHRTQVRFSQTDPAGYVFYPRFFEMFQAAVEDWFYEELEIDYADMFRGGRGLPTAHTECDFINPCRLGDLLELTVLLEKIGKSSITIRFVGRVGETLCLKALSVLVLIDTGDGKPRQIAPDVRGPLEAYARATADQAD
jgi:4-hydroxybenzoyl-CoA thioesterase